MSESGDSCPLCTEEMDFTDLHLKPCKCGYEICVWCWNHVMDMAEKDNKEGKCPACRTPYNKERIIATAANCNRMVSRVNTGRKQNSQKAKSKELAAARQHLTGVRVVQKNLAYITGMPINLSDESLLESKEYFGQYGKVLKVSIRHPAGGTAQHTSCSKTFCVYVTYGQEEEAIRCIQLVHNFILEGKLLRACFGTAKYCRAWLRNVACSNPGCLYLHAMGSQEETFTKDEIITAYTRSRVPRIPSTYVQRRFGNMLPPPIDDSSCCMTSDKTIPKRATNNAMSYVQASYSHAEKSTTVLPTTAKWGLHASSCQPPVGSPSCSQTPTNKKGEPNTSSSVNFSVAAPNSWDDEDVIASITREMNSSSGPMKSGGRFRDCSTTVSDVSSEILQVEAFDASAWDDDIPISSNIAGSSSVNSSLTEAKQDFSLDDKDVIPSSISEMDSSYGPSGPIKSGNRRDCNTTVPDVLSEIRQVEAFDDMLWDDDGIPISSNITGQKNLVHMIGVVPAEPAISSTVGEFRISGLDASSRTTSSMSVISMNCSSSHSTSTTDDMNVCIYVPGSNEDRVHMNGITTVEPARSTSVGDFQVSGLDATSRMTKYASSLLNSPSCSVVQVASAPQDKGTCMVVPVSNTSLVYNGHHTFRQGINSCPDEVCCNRTDDCGPIKTFCSSLSSSSTDRYLKVDRPNLDEHFSSTSNLSSAGKAKNVASNLDHCSSKNGFEDHRNSSICCKTEKVALAEKNITGEKVNFFGRFNGEARSDKSRSSDATDSSIISHILSLDSNTWDDSPSVSGFINLLDEATKRDDSHLLSTSRKSSIRNQSRFSFARQENQLDQLESLRELPAKQKSSSLIHDEYGDGHQRSQFNSAEGPCAVNRDPLVSSPLVSSRGHAGLSRTKLSVPPGFSLKNKVRPLGFSFQGKREQTYGLPYSENNLRTSLDNQYQLKQCDNMANVGFIDPGKIDGGRGKMPVGVGPRFPAEFTLEPYSRLPSHVPQYVSSHESCRSPGHIRDIYLHSNVAHSVPQPMSQNFSSLSALEHMSLHQPKSSLSLSNNREGWNDTETVNKVAMLDNLRNERSRFNNSYPGNEDIKFHEPSADP